HAWNSARPAFPVLTVTLSTVNCTHVTLLAAKVTSAGAEASSGRVSTLRLNWSLKVSVPAVIWSFGFGRSYRSILSSDTGLLHVRRIQVPAFPPLLAHSALGLSGYPEMTPSVTASAE